MKKGNIAFFVPHIGCPHCCSFCDQHLISGADEPIAPARVVQSLSALWEELGDRRRGMEIAFFGGSFTAIDPAQMEAFLEAAAGFTGTDGFAGIRISTRPDALSPFIIDILKRYPVTAVEIGAQSMCDEVLRANGRGHTAADVTEAAKRVAQAGISLGLQMMTGLDLDTPERAEATARALLDLQPDTMRIYPTIVLPGTELARRLHQGTYRPQTLEEAVSLCSRLMLLCIRRSVTVIRAGLHDSPAVRTQHIAGPYHPAFGELCQGRIYRMILEQKLFGAKTPCEAAVRCGPSEVSKVIGHKRENIRAFAEKGIRLTVQADPSVPPFEITTQFIEPF